MPFSQDNPILPVKRIHIRTRLAELGISQLYTNEDIDNALAKVDQNAIYDAERAKIQIEIWDKQTPINDKPANVVLDHLRKIGNWPEGGEIYLLKKNGAIVYMQPHAPNVGGIVKMTADDVMDYAEWHAEEFASHEAFGKIVDAVIDEL